MSLSANAEQVGHPPRLDIHCRPHLMSLVSGGRSKLEATFHGLTARSHFVLAGEGQGQTDLDSCDRPMKTDAGASGKSISRFRKLDRQCHEPGLDNEAEAVRSLRGERLSLKSTPT
jgi:hypothetical protein